jgi:hypothetical protein
VAISNRTAVLRDAARHALAALRILPPSEEAERLLRECIRLEKLSLEWTERAPTDEERGAAMKEVVALHLAVTKLGRESIPK